MARPCPLHSHTSTCMSVCARVRPCILCRTQYHALTSPDSTFVVTLESVNLCEASTSIYMCVCVCMYIACVGMCVCAIQTLFIKAIIRCHLRCLLVISRTDNYSDTVNTFHRGARKHHLILPHCMCMCVCVYACVYA